MMFFAKFLLVLWCMYALEKVCVRCATIFSTIIQVCKIAQNNNLKRRNNLRHNCICTTSRNQENAHT